MLSRFVHANVKRTVHRLETELRFFQLCRRKHHVGIILFVTTDPPQIALGYMRSKDQPITAPLEFLAEIVLHLRANGAAFRMPKHEALPVLFLYRKQIKLAA